tara:strand:- start:1369 stop:2472 length:1104 start_codon:yes stop_codon:yes gene_type:complete
MAITSNIRRYRRAQGLSQEQLAKKVGISRQALIRIESHRQIPSTAVSLMFARALGARVEELFQLADEPHRMRVAKGSKSTTGRVVLGRVDGKLVAHPIQGETTPADGLVCDDMGDDNQLAVECFGTRKQALDQVIVAGCAPILGLIAEYISQQPRLGPVNWQMSNSSRSLKMLREGMVHSGGVHLAPSNGINAHHELARQTFPDTPMALVHIAKWQAGLVISGGNPLGVENRYDLLRDDLRWAMREPGASAHKLHNTLVRELGGLNTRAANTKSPKSHKELAMLIDLGQADVGIAIESVAIQRQLDFIPIVEERFDLLVPKHRLEQPALNQFIDALSSEGLKQQLHNVPGYDVSDCGHVYECTGPIQ